MMSNVEPAGGSDVFRNDSVNGRPRRRDLLRHVLKTLHDQRPPRLTRGFSADGGDPIVEIGPTGTDR